MAKKPTGRPSSFDQDIADEICERMMNGESLRAVCEPDTMPSRSAVFRWLHKADQPGADSKYTSFRDQYMRAKEEQADALFDDCLRIADEAKNDYMDSQEDGGGVAYKLNGEHIQRSRLRIDTRKWMAGKLRPKKYSEHLRVDNTHDVSDPMKELLGFVAGNGGRVGDAEPDEDA